VTSRTSAVRMSMSVDMSRTGERHEASGRLHPRFDWPAR
jgi:hypothetical protein